MAWLAVEKYWLGYSIPTKQFYFYYKLAGDSTQHQIVATPEEFLALTDMFRYEKPISYSTDSDYFVTGAEDIGEGE